jgi:hypothetical protein
VIQRDNDICVRKRRGLYAHTTTHMIHWHSVQTAEAAETLRGAIW